MATAGAMWALLTSCYIFLRIYLIKDYEIFNNSVFSLKVLQPLMATAGGMWALLINVATLHFSSG